MPEATELEMTELGTDIRVAGLLYRERLHWLPEATFSGLHPDCHWGLRLENHCYQVKKEEERRGPFFMKKGGAHL